MLRPFWASPAMAMATSFGSRRGTEGWELVRLRRFGGERLRLLAAGIWGRGRAFEPLITAEKGCIEGLEALNAALASRLVPGHRSPHHGAPPSSLLKRLGGGDTTGSAVSAMRSMLMAVSTGCGVVGVFGSSACARFLGEPIGDASRRLDHED